MTNPILFEHVPKCAGTTLVNILGRKYPPRRILHVIPARREDQINAYADLDEVGRKKYDLIMGHGVYQFRKYLPGEVKAFTFLRNPVDRVISNYFYILDQPGHHLYDRIIGEGIGLKEYLTSGVTRTVHNYITRAVSLFRLSELTADPQAALETALENLENDFFFIGLVEHFDLSLLLLGKNLEWPDPPYYYRENVSRYPRGKHHDVDSEIIGIIQEQNQLDQKIYEYAVKRFEELNQKNPEILTSQLSAFQLANQQYSRRKRPQKLLRDIMVFFRKLVLRR